MAMHDDRLTALKGELQALERAFNREATDPAELVSKDGYQAIWKVKLDKGQFCFMSVDSCEGNDTKWVVHVDADRFYYRWLKSFKNEMLKGQVSFDVPLRQDMHLDRKFADAVEGFAEGVENPVPLADVNVYEMSGFDRIVFGGGITRTLWLLSHHAQSFPVSVSGSEEASFLQKLAGASVQPVSYEELLVEP